MSINYPKSGPNNAPQYQMSGVPHITRGTAPTRSTDPGDCLHIRFPYVTREIKIKNAGGVGLRVGFTASGSVQNAAHSIVIATGKTVSYDFRCRDLFFMSDHGSTTCAFELVAGLTLIPSGNFPILTGSLSDGSAGFSGVG